MKIHWCAIYDKDGEEIAGRVDLCDTCLDKALSKGEVVYIPYDCENSGICERCSRKVGTRE